MLSLRPTLLIEDPWVIFQPLTLLFLEPFEAWPICTLYVLYPPYSILRILWGSSRPSPMPISILVGLTGVVKENVGVLRIHCVHISCYF